MSIQPHEHAPQGQYHSSQNEMRPPVVEQETKNHKLRNRIVGAVAGVAVFATGGLVAKEVFGQSNNTEPRDVPSTSAPAVPGAGAPTSVEAAPTTTTHEAPAANIYEINSSDYVDNTNVVIDVYVPGEDGADHYTGVRTDGQGHFGYVANTAAGKSSHPDPVEAQKWMLTHTISNGMNVGTKSPNAQPVAMEFMHDAANESVGGHASDLSVYMGSESEQNRAEHTHSYFTNVHNVQNMGEADGTTQVGMDADYVKKDANGKITETDHLHIQTAAALESGAWANQDYFIVTDTTN